MVSSPTSPGAEEEAQGSLTVTGRGVVGGLILLFAIFYTVHSKAWLRPLLLCRMAMESRGPWAETLEAERKGDTGGTGSHSRMGAELRARLVSPRRYKESDGQQEISPGWAGLRRLTLAWGPLQNPGFYSEQEGKPPEEF